MNVEEYRKSLTDLVKSRGLNMDEDPFVTVGDKFYTFKTFIDGLENENANDITKKIVNIGTEMLNKILLEE